MSQLSTLLGVLRMDRMLLGCQEPLWTEAATKPTLQLHDKKNPLRIYWNATAGTLPVIYKSLFGKIAQSHGSTAVSLSWAVATCTRTCFSPQGVTQPERAVSLTKHLQLCAERALWVNRPGHFLNITQVPALRRRTGERQEPNY